MLGSLLLTVGLFAGVETAANDAANLATYTSYTKAWHVARDESRPLLVVLNPSASDGQNVPVDVATLRRDSGLGPVLDHYVVVDIDTSTAQGQKVLEAFKSPALPRIVVIDNRQEVQVFATSQKVSNAKLKSVLETLKAGKATTTTLDLDLLSSRQMDCPNCRRKLGL